MKNQYYWILPFKLRNQCSFKDFFAKLIAKFCANIQRCVLNVEY